jgi:protocatechuate 3,4-dioxygenase beta subunit
MFKMIMQSLLLTLLAITSSLAHSPRHLDNHQSLHLATARSICRKDVHCILTPETTEGPFYVAHPLVRSNITEDRVGIPLTLSINIIDVKTCAPVPDVYVDIWHADASMGEYSGWASDLLDNASPFTAFGIPVDGSRWLRGVTPTDEDGLATFHTIWPGWYQGRCTHIHIRIHTGNTTLDHGVFLGSSRTAHTGQLFFSDKLVTEVSKSVEPYISRRKELLPKMNGDDGIFVNEGGGEQIVDVTKHGNAFLGSVTVGIDLTADHTGDHDHMRPPPWGRHRPGSHVSWVLWAALGVAFLIALFYCFRLYMARRNARMGYTPTQQEEVDRMTAGERRTSYGAI